MSILQVNIQPLDHTHDRGAFECGVKFIDNYLAKKSLGDHEVHKVRIYVACEPSQNVVLGFYTLSLAALQPSDTTPEEAQAKFGSWAIPVVYLGQIGVRVPYQRGSGIGSALMLHAFERTIAIADIAGTYGLMLDAINEDVAQWYERLGFAGFATEDDGRIKMMCPLNLIRAALEHP